MPTYEAQRALPPTEGTIKESWLAHRGASGSATSRRRGAARSRTTRRGRPETILDAEAAPATAPAAATRYNKDRFERQRTFHEHNFERHVKDCGCRSGASGR